MGLSGLFGLSKSQNGQPATRLPIGYTAPGPTTAAGTPATTAAPPSAGQAGSLASVAAQMAANKARKKATGAAGSSLPQPTGSVLAPTLQPKSLLGY